jgi:hypothetical protein
MEIDKSIKIDLPSTKEQIDTSEKIENNVKDVDIENNNIISVIINTEKYQYIPSFNTNPIYENVDLSIYIDK